MGAKTVFIQRPRAVLGYPFLAETLLPRLQGLGDVVERILPREKIISEAVDLSDVDFIFYSGGTLTDACVRSAPKLKAVATYTDNTGYGLPTAALRERGIPVIDYTRGAAVSVAEIALALTLCGLRRIPMWHNTLAGQAPMQKFLLGQFCDDPDFVNGTLCLKRVGIIGLGQIGRRVASYCLALGATVAGYDPYLPAELFARSGVEQVDVDRLVDQSEIVIVTVPPTPSAHHLLNRERIGRLRKGTLVVVVTRAHAVDMTALRERIVADELAGAFDVYDVEPVPIDDPLRGRHNVVHLPHIAGRTMDHNTRSANIIADDFERVWRGEAPQNALSWEAAAVRAQVTDLPY
jgi:D-3-phosphoglycerate dehydrogenase